MKALSLVLAVLETCIYCYLSQKKKKGKKKKTKQALRIFPGEELGKNNVIYR